MTTITEAQNNLEQALDNVKIPDDMTDWDMEDWTIFALSYLQANLDDALEGIDEGEDTEPSFVSAGHQEQTCALCRTVYLSTMERCPKCGSTIIFA